MSESSEDPFALLGLAPTLDGTAVRRAWMQAVKRHPPHSDPSGFQRLRTAYERLSSADTLRDAWLAAPFDAATELARYDARDGAEIARLRAEAGERHAAEAQIQARGALAGRFGRALAAWSLGEWERRRG